MDRGARPETDRLWAGVLSSKYASQALLETADELAERRAARSPRWETATGRFIETLRAALPDDAIVVNGHCGEVPARHRLPRPER